jgi:hypothetical protein
MPLKSWAFIHDGHAVRAEIWWRFSGWNRKKLYIDHRCVLTRQGRFTVGLPLQAEIGSSTEGKQPIEIRFRLTRLGLDMACDCTINSERIVWDHLPTQIETKRQHSATADGMPGVIYDNNIGILVVFPVLIVLIFLGVLAVPLSIVGGMLNSMGNKRLKARLRKHGRYLSWTQIEERMRSSNSISTLIVESESMGLRTWWSEQDLVSASPLPLPDVRVMSHPGRYDHPFFEWCWHYHLSEQTGTAILTDMPSHILKQIGFFEEGRNPACCRILYPTLNVVNTGHVHGRRATAAPKFASILGKSLDESIPDLIEGLKHDDSTVRQMCREAVGLAGPKAVKAVPLLTHQFYFGTWKERYSVAQTLAELGPAGESVLKEAAGFDDPYLRSPAFSTLYMHEIRRKESTAGDRS